MPRRNTLLSTAQHEASHVVVGVTLGLRLIRASARRGEGYLGITEFWLGAGDDLAFAVTVAAGVAHERRVKSRGHREDRAWLESRGYSAKNQRVLVKLAWEVLERRRAAHRAVTDLLVEREVITHRDVQELILRKSAC